MGDQDAKRRVHRKKRQMQIQVLIQMAGVLEAKTVHHRAYREKVHYIKCHLSFGWLGSRLSRRGTSNEKEKKWIFIHLLTSIQDSTRNDAESDRTITLSPSCVLCKRAGYSLRASSMKRHHLTLIPRRHSNRVVVDTKGVSRYLRKTADQFVDKDSGAHSSI